ncbi:ATP-dependent DNA helicase [Trichonephila clavipes]|nr:ATP-dependent DNA helicase [Trichonephila clavipes]
MRVQLQQDESSERFAKQLLDIGNGKMEIDESTHCITLPENFCHIVNSAKELIAKVFPNLSQNYKSNQWVSERAILAAKNIDVNLINCSIQNKIPEEETTYKSIDTVVNQDESVHYPIVFKFIGPTRNSTTYFIFENWFPNHPSTKYKSTSTMQWD